MMKSEIKFINHASIAIKCGQISILCDPWYEGDAFNGGWNLLFENDPYEIEEIVKNVSYIWISHEHPDHFSIKFFTRYKSIILNRNTQVLFQQTKDRRVINYLNISGFNTKEIPFNTKINLAPALDITLFKDGFYDSALLIEHQNEKILNLNDCEINSIEKARKIHALTGPVDVLLTQFSYAAWKGGRDNLNWRQNAAKDKITTIKMQAEIFKPKYIIPFASYVYFSNELNFYLNDSVNTPKEVYKDLNGLNLNIVVLKPNDIFDSNCSENKKNIEYWDGIYKNIDSLRKNKYKSFNLVEIQAAYETYSQRIRKNNNIYLMMIVSKLRVFRAFNPVKIYIDDLNMTVLLDIFSKKLSQTNSEPDLKMPSASLHFLFKNSFGFDTLTVNGCFEEARKNGFIESTKTLAIENLNNMGISFSLQLIFNLAAIRTFTTRLSRLKRKMEDN